MNKTKLEFVAKIIIGLCIVIILFLFALNGRYARLSEGSILDNWKKEVLYEGTKELPIRENGKLVTDK